MPLFTAPWHTLFDLIAYAASALLFRAELRSPRSVSPALEQRGYWISLTFGAFSGAWLFGTWNLSDWRSLVPAHSLAGAIAGAVVGAELFKRWAGIRGSTGAPFVIPISAGIAIGRLGCFFAGLNDHTFGSPSSVPWAVNMGDGIPRHPVALYESASLAIFLPAAVGLRTLQPEAFRASGFYVFLFYYSAQRFGWEFLKPYATVIGPLNLFHFLCLGLAVYAAGMLWVSNANRLGTRS